MKTIEGKQDVNKLKSEAKTLMLNRNYKQAVSLFQKVYTQSPGKWNALFLLRALRKASMYAEAYNLKDQFSLKYPDFLPMEIEFYWLTYAAKIKYNSNPDMLNEAELLLMELVKDHPYTSRLYVKVVLSVAKYLIQEGHYSNAIRWLHSIADTINNDITRLGDSVLYDVDKKRYFLYYADALIKNDKVFEFIQESLFGLELSGRKFRAFNDFLKRDLTVEDGKIHGMKLAHYLMYLLSGLITSDRDMSSNILMIKADNLGTYNLKSYMTCNGGFASNFHYITPFVSPFFRNEFDKGGMTFADLYHTHNQSGPKDTNINGFIESIANYGYLRLGPLFDSEMLINHMESELPEHYTTNNAFGLYGGPDYEKRDSNGNKFLVTECYFPADYADNRRLESKEMMESHVLLEGEGKEDIAYAYNIIWFWDYVKTDNLLDFKGRSIKIQKFRLHKVMRNPKQMEIIEYITGNLKYIVENGPMMTNRDCDTEPVVCLNCDKFGLCEYKKV